MTIVLVVLSIIVSSILTWFILTRQLKRRFKSFKQMTKAMSGGNFDYRLEISTKDELSDLARGLNEVSQQFQKRIHEITADKEELQAIFSSMVEGVVVISATGHLDHVSPTFRRMLELRSQETERKLYWEIIWNQEINDSIKEALVNKKAVNKEVHIISPQELYFNMQISPVINPSGKLISVVAVFHDITDLKRLERVRSEFVANVSHELKTPLTSIKGFIETLKGSLKDDPESALRFLDIIGRQTERLENLVNDLLILSSIESQEVKMSIVPEEISGILQNAIDLCKGQSSAKHQKVTLRCEGNLPKVLVDKERIEQVFLNLLDNAIKFTPEDGSITIHALLQGEFVRINVEDNGIGIAANHIPRLFERFYRVDLARSRDTGGTGLGLSIVKHLIYAHQGKLSVTSTLNKGSTFSVFLPHI